MPESWWVEKNKGMVLGVTGEWQLEQPAEENLPVPPVVTGKVIDDDVAADTSNKEEPKIPVAEGKKKGTGSKFLPACFRGPVNVND